MVSVAATMYGLLLQGIEQAIKAEYGEQAWLDIIKQSGIPHRDFYIQKCYSETLIPRITKAAAEYTNTSSQQLMRLFGNSFVHFLGNYGYDRILRVLGRNLRDFLSGLDNLHEYLRFSYTKLKPPSFFVEDEGPDGLTLHYRTRRKGFLYYVIGQIQAVGQIFYNTPVDVTVISEDESLDLYLVILRLKFQNTAYRAASREELGDSVSSMEIHSDVFFDVFPFHVVFDGAMIISHVGVGLGSVMPGVVGNAVDEMFQLVRPLVEFIWDNVSNHKLS